MKHIFCLISAFMITLAHADTQRLINTRDMYPSPSPDGRQVVFQSSRTGSNQLFIMDVAENGQGTNIRQLTNFAKGAETPAFSPDGQWIVFAAYLEEGNNDVFIINPDGTGQRQLTDGPGYDGHPHWSSDGQRIVFNSDRSSPDPDAPWNQRWHEIYSMNVDGSDVRKLTDCRSVCTYGSVSPDKTKVLYRRVIDGVGLGWDLSTIERNSEVFIADIDGSNEQNLSNNAAFDGWPVWSPDGRQIAFASNRSGPALTGQIWIMEADGSNPRQVSDGQWSYVQPAWSADGKSIYAYQNRETPDDEFGTIARIDLPSE